MNHNTPTNTRFFNTLFTAIYHTVPYSEKSAVLHNLLISAFSHEWSKKKERWGKKHEDKRGLMLDGISGVLTCVVEHRFIRFEVPYRRVNKRSIRILSHQR